VIGQALDTGSAQREPGAKELEQARDLSLKELEQRYLEQLMRLHGDDKETVAAIAGVSVRSLYRKLRPRGPEG
jgi:DNA-binding NtrC family response regulator